MSQVGTTDIVEIIQHYHGPSFKFASRNFYAEFLAALDVERHFSDYFGDLNGHPPMRTETVRVPDYVTFQTLCAVTGTDPDTLADLNPALSREVVAGKLHVPKGYRARVPDGAADTFEVRYASLPAQQKFTPAAGVVRDTSGEARPDVGGDRQALRRHDRRPSSGATTCVKGKCESGRVWSFRAGRRGTQSVKRKT